jgi:hypothetical protein
MIRLFLRLLKITDFEVCPSCETLKQQLAFERAEKQQLTETLLNIIKPKAFEAPTQELNPIINTSALFSRRRAALESKDREEAKILRGSTNLGKPDDSLREINKNVDVTQLETELGIEAKEG